jgi:hypothetical protein
MFRTAKSVKIVRMQSKDIGAMQIIQMHGMDNNPLKARKNVVPRRGEIQRSAAVIECRAITAGPTLSGRKIVCEAASGRPKNHGGSEISDG